MKQIFAEPDDAMGSTEQLKRILSSLRERETGIALSRGLVGAVNLFQDVHSPFELGGDRNDKKYSPRKLGIPKMEDV